MTGIDVAFYNEHRGIYSPLVEHNGILCGFWLCGQNYRNPSRLYGAYPPSYMKRIALLFPDPDVVLHLFSGDVKTGAWNKGLDFNPYPPEEDTFDILPNYNPLILGDAHNLVEVINAKWDNAKEEEIDIYDLVLADPPYGKNHEKYGTPPVNKRKVIKECAKVIHTSGHLVWLDTIIPIWAKKDGWKLRGTIGLVQSTNHQCRVITILERIEV